MFTDEADDYWRRQILALTWHSRKTRKMGGFVTKKVFRAPSLTVARGVQNVIAPVAAPPEMVGGVRGWSGCDDRECVKSD